MYEQISSGWKFSGKMFKASEFFTFLFCRFQTGHLKIFKISFNSSHSTLENFEKNPKFFNISAVTVFALNWIFKTSNIPLQEQQESFKKQSAVLRRFVANWGWPLDKKWPLDIDYVRAHVIKAPWRASPMSFSATRRQLLFILLIMYGCLYS